MLSLVAVLLLAQAPDAGASADCPSEDAMFGGGEATPAVDGGADTADAGTGTTPPRDEAILEAKYPYQATDLPPENPLTIGGMLYLRSQVSASENQPPSQWLLSAPFLLDTYLDARPNDRVRGFVLVRTEWDPTYNPAQPTQYGITFPASPNPDFLIDQMWIKFDIEREVFVTAGRQHVKWGTAHFWFPNDLLNPVRLQPLAVFDQRTGVTMVKANLPLSDENLNLYAIGLFEGLQQANQFGKLGGAARAEYVLGSFEFGLDMVATEGQHNRYGGDISFGLWDFDLYAEGSFTNDRDNPIYVQNPAFAGQTLGSNCDLLALGGPSACLLPSSSGNYQPQIAAGLNYAVRYGNNRNVVFGGEYFYNGLGYTNPVYYIPVVLNNAGSFFYLGQNYAGLYVLADKPGSWYNSTVNFSTLANLSDQSFISRIDFFQTVLTHLRVEAFADVHYGNNGEFHFSIPANEFGLGLPASNVSAPIFDFGLALRLSL